MSGGASRTTTQESTPWEGQTPYLSDLFRHSQSMFNQGPQQFYPGPTVSPFSPQSQMGLDMMTGRALSGSPYESAFGNYLTSTLGQGNMDPNAIFTPASQAAGGIGAGQNMMAAAGQPTSYGDAAGMAGMGGGDPASQQLAGTAGGAFLGSNPYLDQVYNTSADRLTERFNEDIMPSLAGQFGSAGRTGSGSHALMAGRAAGEMTDSLGQLGASIYAPAYESERNRQMDAAGMYGQQDIARRGMASDIYTGGLNRMLQAGQGMGQLGLGGLGAMGDLYGDIGNNQFRAGSLVPSMAGLDYGNIDRLMQAGGTIEDQTQRLMDAEFQRYMFGQQAPWDAMNQYANTIYGLPGGYGTQTSTPPRGSRLAGAAGGGMAGASLGPWGALGGAVLGGLLGG